MYLIKRTITYLANGKTESMYLKNSHVFNRFVSDRSAAKEYYRKKDALADLRKAKQRDASAAKYELIFEHTTNK